jgi:RNA polymerase sigma-70 factor (ECF subfamily)
MEHDQSDAVLMNRLADGDETALESIMGRYKSPVLNFVYRILGNQADAEDVAQDVFVRIYQHRLDYDPKRSFSTWIFGIAHNAAIDRLRWRKKHPADPLDDTLLQAASHEPSPASATADNELSAIIASAVAELPEDQRVAFVLSEYNDQSHAEIAAIMKISEKAVESRLYRARQTLRQRLKSYLD